MKKKIDKWSISKLGKMYDRINFPEFQREPNVWSKDAKQKLVDSIAREFDISSLYFYSRDEELIECVDGRQRIGAIMSFLGKNTKDMHNAFEFKLINELYEDGQHKFDSLRGKTFEQIERQAENSNCETSKEFISAIEAYELTVVMLSDSKEHNEFNLQFARLNLGVIINSGEKLNAMVGELRDECFEELGRHEFLELVNIPERRFSREQTAAQILTQVFSIESNRRIDGELEFARARHFDLQRLFKEHTTLSGEQKIWIQNLKNILDLLLEGIQDLKFIRSRAVILSLILLAYTRMIKTKEDALQLCKFMGEFSSRLTWQVRKGLSVDEEYKYLIESFQKHVTQASVEKPAVFRRAEVLEKELSYWQNNQMLEADQKYKLRTGESAEEVCRKELLGGLNL